MFFPTVTSLGCYVTPPIWRLQFANPNHIYIAWAIAIAALFAAALPFLKGYRLGGHVPYSLWRHLILTLVLSLFPIGFYIIAPYPASLGGALLELFLLPLFAIRDLLFSPLFGHPKITIWPLDLFLYLLYCTAAAGIMLRFDRRLYKKSNSVMQQIGPTTDPQEEKCSPLS